MVNIKNIVTYARPDCVPRNLYTSYGQKAVGVPTNKKRVQSSGSCRICGDLDKARHVVLTALLVKVQYLRKRLDIAVEGDKYKRKRKRSDSVLRRKSLHRQKNPKSNMTTQKRHQNFDYTMIADRLRTVSWGNDSYPTGVVKDLLSSR